jgi:hypothetical protein
MLVNNPAPGGGILVNRSAQGGPYLVNSDIVGTIIAGKAYGRFLRKCQEYVDLRTFPCD